MSLRRWAGCAAVLLLAGCVSPEEQARLDHNSDNRECVSFGFEPGTVEYSDCLQKQAHHRERTTSKELARLQADTDQRLEKMQDDLEKGKLCKKYKNDKKYQKDHDCL